MGLIGDTIGSIKKMKIRRMLTQPVNLGMVISITLIMFKAFICITGCQSPGAVVLSGSMEPAFQRGDLLFLYNSKDPIRVGEIVVFNLEGHAIPIVHRVIKVHERGDTGEVDILTKGDNNPSDDRMLYPPGQIWIQQHHIIGRAVGYLPYAGWVTILVYEPITKCIIGVLSGPGLVYYYWFNRDVKCAEAETEGKPLQTTSTTKKKRGKKRSH